MASNVYTPGYFIANADFDPGAGVFKPISGGFESFTAATLLVAGNIYGVTEFHAEKKT